MPWKTTELSDFTKFLRTKHKRKGDKLVPSTIERYTDFMKKHWSALKAMDKLSLMIDYMNSKVKHTNSIVLYSSFKNLLIFLGASKEAQKKLETPRSSASALTSKRFLQTKVLSRGELKRIFTETTDLQTKFLISALYDTACRRSELLGLKLSDVKWNKDKADRDKTGIYCTFHVMGKGRKAREVNISKTSAVLLMQLVKELKLKLTDKVIVFIYMEDGEPYLDQARELYGRIRDTCSPIIGRSVHPHMFRHTFATHMADEGAGALDIAAYLGHEDIRTTQIYIEISSHRARLAFANYAKDILI